MKKTIDKWGGGSVGEGLDVTGGATFQGSTAITHNGNTIINTSSKVPIDRLPTESSWTNSSSYVPLSSALVSYIGSYAQTGGEKTLLYSSTSNPSTGTSYTFSTSANNFRFFEFRGRINSNNEMITRLHYWTGTLGSSTYPVHFADNDSKAVVGYATSTRITFTYVDTLSAWYVYGIK